MFRVKVNWIRKLQKTDRLKTANVSIFIDNYYIRRVDIPENHLADFLKLFELCTDTKKSK